MMIMIVKTPRSLDFSPVVQDKGKGVRDLPKDRW